MKDKLSSSGPAAPGCSPEDEGLGSASLEARLAALRDIVARPGRRARRGINLHIHTNESFSVFRSPSEAVAQAVREGVAVLGINDHYTTAGHDEFRRACALAGLEAGFAMEAVAMDRAAQAAGELLNDPDNPGRVYLCAKGVTHYPSETSEAGRTLVRMRDGVARRSREMAGRVAELFRERLGADGPAWPEVLALTPRGNVTERHVAKTALARVRELAAERAEDAAALLARLCATPPPAGADGAALQNFIRGKLLKSGGPCFVREAEDAFISFEELRRLFLAFGAVPTYPVLGNPVTGGERDVGKLLDRLEGLGIHAIEVIPHRNTRERLAEILAAARARHWPVFNGTEHNTAEARPMLDPFALDPEFEPHFAASARVILEHQRRAALGRPGFVDGAGQPTVPDARERFEEFSSERGKS
jgi:hypothetical protein